MQQTAMSDLPKVVCTQPKTQRSSDDLWRSCMQKRVAQEGVPAMEQRQPRLLQGQLPAKKARRLLWCSFQVPPTTRRPFQVRTTPSVCSRRDRSSTPDYHWVFGPTTHQTLSRGVEEPSCCKWKTNCSPSRCSPLRSNRLPPAPSSMLGNH